MTDDPDDLKRLSDRIAEAGRKRQAADETLRRQAPNSSASIAVRFIAELVGALFVGGCLGWCVDWAFDHWSPWHTRPWGVVLMFMLGVVAGIRNVMSAAKEINAELAQKDMEK